MRKWITALFSAAAVFMMSFTSFAAENPAELMDRVTARSNALDSMDCDMGIHMVAVMDDQGPEAQMKIDMAMKMQMENVRSGDLRYKAEMATELLGQTEYSVVFYDDGWYYVDAAGTKVKYPMDLEGMVKSMEGTTAMTDLSSSYMKAMTVEEINGLRVLFYEADAARMNDYLQEVMGTVLSGMNLDMDMNIQDVQGAYVINDTDDIIGMTMTMTFGMDFMGEKVTYIVLMEGTVKNPGQPVTVSLPSKEGYEDLAGFFDGLITE